VHEVLQLQDDIKSSVTMSTENLARMNDFASKEYATMVKDFQKHTKMMKEMKQDLDYIFQKIRTTKIKMNTAWPEAAMQVQNNNS